MKQFRLKKADILLALAVLLIACVCFLLLHVLPQSGREAVVEQNGTVLVVLPLDKDAVFDVVSDRGVTTNTVQVKDGAVSVTYADCPDKICRNHRAIQKSGESIVCLPNKVMVTIKADTAEVDGAAS